ncbi:MAG: Maf family nucleotide pyrophosphatase [Cyclobacteriaceae bacterium]|nr:Maf family nucleotide pyrophosphatase [Cyclobacteriaceae bacterium]
MGYKFECVSIDCDETYPSDLPTEDVALFLAKKKASQYISDLSENTVLITADTIVRVGEQILGKPANQEEAIEMLQLISGSRHQVTTGICLSSKSNSISFDDTTEVYFHSLSLKEITWYVENYKPFDKAGAYGIQEWIGMTGIDRIEGSYFNVVGLPTHKLYHALLNFSL